LSEIEKKTSPVRQGVLIMNADDWGRDTANTDRTLDCVARGTVTAVSAMVFMEDSERAAKIAREQGIDVGLHLNFTTPFSGPGVSAVLGGHLEKVSRYLLKSRSAQVVYHPGLTESFKYLVSAQREEFCKLYGAEPKRLDGHHHMHLCANVLMGGLLPAGTKVRRNFSFFPGEKSFANRLYRRAMDGLLARRHELSDFFFSLPPLTPLSRLQKIFALANEFKVEVETHPVSLDEYRFLTGEEIHQLTSLRADSASV
jgi:chitin disaccharide deacetylase